VHPFSISIIADKMSATAPLQAPPAIPQPNPDQAAGADTKESLEDKMHFYSRFARAAYQHETGDPDPIEGYHIDKRFSNGNRVLYASDTDSKKAVYAFRGTSGVGDIGTDVLNTIGLNRFAARNQNAARAAKSAQSIYSDLTLTGHSLGGEEALFAAKSLKTPPSQTVVFAPHVNSFQSMADTAATKLHDLFFKPRERQPSNTYIYKTKTDPVTAYISDTYQNAHIITTREKNPLNPHSMESFLPD
jgi:hypothetical protein